MLRIAWPFIGWLRLGVVAAVACTAASAMAAEKGCPVASNAFDYEPHLTKTLEALNSGREVTLVAVGGASTEGRAAGGPEASWPARLADVLRERYPSARINLVVRAAPRPTATDMASKFESNIAPLRPTLVIWEAGTTDAVRGTDIEEFRIALQSGIDALRASAAEIVLMDMQYSPMTHSVVHFNRYLIVLRGIADVTDTPLFPRHRIMYDWSEMGFLETSDRNAEGRRALADWLYRCVGRSIADFITRQPPADTADQK